MNNATDFSTDLSFLKGRWLPLEEAIERVVRFEHTFGKSHLALACHAALASILTPELVNLIRINFLEKAVDWIAECDMLLSPLCMPLQPGIYEIEPQVRQVLLVLLQTEYGATQPEELAGLLYYYLDSSLASKLPTYVKRTYQWISSAYLVPDEAIQSMTNFLSKTPLQEPIVRSANYQLVGKTLAMLASPLEMTNLQVELDDLTESIYLVLQGYSDQTTLHTLVQSNLDTLDEAIQPLTSYVTTWLSHVLTVAETPMSHPTSISMRDRSIDTISVVNDNRMAAPETTADSQIDEMLHVEMTPISVFCVYAYEDELLVKDLESFLRPLQDEELITYWSERELVHAEDREQAIERHLNVSQILLLFISNDLIASDYLYDVVLKRVIERYERGEVRVIPIIARPCGWLELPIIERLQPLPMNGQPISKWSDPKAAFHDVVTGIRHVVADLQKSEVLVDGPLPLPEMFIICAPRDEIILARLERALSLLTQQGLVKTWSDRQILPGAQVNQTIEAHLESATVILLLVSHELLSSEYCGHWIERALQRREAGEAHVIPIIARPCDWRNAAFAYLPVMPVNASPITTWNNQDLAFAEVIDGIRQVIEAPQPLSLPAVFRPKQFQPLPRGIYISYAQADYSLLDELEKHLSPLRQQGLITLWPDRQMQQVADWSVEDYEHLNTASIILLLVSANFLASTYCSNETMRALQRQETGEARVVPILARPCDWQGLAFAHLPALPANAEPITIWNNQDLAFAEIVAGIRQVLEAPQPALRSPVLRPKKTQPIPSCEIFISYSHTDEVLMTELEKHLSALRQLGLITLWSDRQIRTGDDWQQLIEEHLNTAPIILFLVSEEFLASSFLSRETLRALQRQEADETLVIPILLRPCNWQNTAFARLSVLPADATPIMAQHNQDFAFTEVATGIRQIVENLAKRVTNPVRTGKRVIWGIPNPPRPPFFRREAILELIARALNTDKQDPIAQALSGPGGVGKTWLALEYAYSHQNEYQYVFWVSAEARERLDTAYKDLATLLDLPEKHQSEQFLINDALKGWLATHSGWLLVLDGADDLNLIREYIPSVYPGHLLLTTRAYDVGSLAEKIEIPNLYKDEMGMMVLLCYAREDQLMVNQLKMHLSFLQHNRLINLCDYGSITADTEGESKITRHLNEAQVILLFISASFLASHYFYNVEMQQAIRRHERGEARVIPVILRSAYWNIPPLDKLQAIPDQGKPVSSWRPRDSGFTNVINGIMEVLEQWNTHNFPGPAAERAVMIKSLGQFMEAIKSHLQPPGRANAVAGTLEQLSIFIPNDVVLADLIVGWQTVSRILQEEEAQDVAQRRVTCSELAALASQVTNEQGNLAQAIRTWQEWVNAFQNSNDPRHSTMAKTFARELAEMQETISDSLHLDEDV